MKRIQIPTNTRNRLGERRKPFFFFTKILRPPSAALSPTPPQKPTYRALPLTPAPLPIIPHTNSYQTTDYILLTREYSLRIKVVDLGLLRHDWILNYVLSIYFLNYINRTSWVKRKCQHLTPLSLDSLVYTVDKNRFAIFNIAFLFYYPIKNGHHEIRYSQIT